MSFAYGLAARVRATAIKENRPDDQAKIIELFAALVPAEVLAAHGAILAFTTDSTGGTPDSAFPVLRLAFWALIVAAAFLFAAGRGALGTWNKLDAVRIFIPPVAFVGWTMLQKPSAFDAVCSTIPVCSALGAPLRFTLAVLLALFLTGAATWLHYKAAPGVVRRREVDVVVLQS